MSHALLRRPFPCDLGPERVALLVRGDERPFALIGDWAGGGALVGSAPVRVAAPGEDVFALLEEQPVVTGAGGAVGGGWFGGLGFGLARAAEPVGAGPPRPAPLPDATLAFYDHLLRADADGRWWFEALVAPAREAAIEARWAELCLRAQRGPPEPRPFATAPWRPVPGWAAHAAAVAACRERIHAGDLFQANVCLRLESRLDGDPLDLWAAGVAALRPARAAFFAGPWGAVASLSPELFLARGGRSVRTAPIKGTRPRGQRAALAASAKDRAENVMIVDLMRNDLGRVCAPGTVRVPLLCDVRPHAGVWHLVSEVTGELRDGAGDAALLRATFPPGSVTGAPKVAALGVVAELESTGREAYTGALGFASPLAGLELSVAIRTFEARAGRLWLGVGGGVVADSDPEAEARECAVKAAPLLAAIGGRMAAEVPGGSPGAPGRRGPRPDPRPDPALGVFTTLAARGGEPAEAEAHLARLRASVLELYGVALPAEAEALVRGAAARSPAPARIRLTARPARRGGLELGIDRRPLPRPGPVRLRTVRVPGGLGAHKWVDRRLLDALAASMPGEVPLLLDADGLVLEASRSNVAIREGDGLVTPPLDGRILPGVGRAGLGALEEPVGFERLLAADAVLLVGGARGVEPVTAVDGRRRAHAAAWVGSLASWAPSASSRAWSGRSPG